MLLGLSAAADATLTTGPEAIRLWREAVRLFEGAGTSFDEADARVELATVLLGTGDPNGAAEQLERATRTFTELSADSELTRVRAVSAATRRACGEPPGPLSPRETQVLAFVAQGLSNARIAEELVLSEHTVHRHVANILTKLAVPSRAAAAAYAVHAGLLPS